MSPFSVFFSTLRKFSPTQLTGIATMLGINNEMRLAESADSLAMQIITLMVQEGGSGIDRLVETVQYITGEVIDQHEATKAREEAEAKIESLAVYLSNETDKRRRCYPFLSLLTTSQLQIVATALGASDNINWGQSQYSIAANMPYYNMGLLRNGAFANVIQETYKRLSQTFDRLNPNK